MEIKSEKENVLYYTDGHAVTVTDTVLQVNHKWYSLNGITKHGFLIVPPMRLPGILMILLGLALIVVGKSEWIANGTVSQLAAFEWTLDANDLFIIGGVLLLVPGIVMMVLIREKYAVCITTAEGEKKVVVSNKKEYISQIVGALNEAFFARLNSENRKDYKREFTVSGR